MSDTEAISGLCDRIAEAQSLLLLLASTAIGAERARLQAKAEGVALAASYLAELLR